MRLVRITLLGMLATIASAVPALAAPQPPAIVGAVVLNDASYAARHGLEARATPAPRLAPAPALRGWGADGRLVATGAGRIALFGRYLWYYEGADPLHLRPRSWGGGFSRYVGAPVVIPGDGFLQVADATSGGNLTRYDSDGALRWSIPGPGVPGAGAVPQGPVAVGGSGVIYAVGGAASVIDDRTGGVIAPLGGLPLYNYSAVAAPDGTLRVLYGFADETLAAYGPDGRRLWTTPLGAQSATPLSVGPDGTTYLGMWSGSGGIRITSGELVAVAPDGGIRWRARIGRRPSRPAIDEQGVAWTLTIDGVLHGVGRGGDLRFRRRVAPATSYLLSDPVSAVGRDVLVNAAGTTVRVASRRQRPAGVAPRLTVSPARMRLRTSPAGCVAPPAGRPRSCVYRLGAGGAFRIDAPSDGRARLEIRDAGGRLLTRLGPYRLLAGQNRIRFHGDDGEICNAFHPCLLPPGAYRVRARIPLGAGRARWLSAPFTVLPSRGRIVG